MPLNNFIYIWSNIGCASVIFFILCFYFIKDRKYVKTLTVTDVGYLSLLVSLNIVLSNLLGFNFLFFGYSFQLALGQWVIFIAAIYYRIVGGLIVAVCSEIVGDVVNLGGVFHIGYLLVFCVLAIIGGLSRNFKNKKWAVMFVFSLFLILKSLVLNPIIYYWSGYSSLAFASIIPNLIKMPVLLVMYNAILLCAYTFFDKILSKH